MQLKERFVIINNRVIDLQEAGNKLLKEAQARRSTRARSKETAIAVFCALIVVYLLCVFTWLFWYVFGGDSHFSILSLLGKTILAVSEIALLTSPVGPLVVAAAIFLFFGYIYSIWSD